MKTTLLFILLVLKISQTLFGLHHKNTTKTLLGNSSKLSLQKLSQTNEKDNGQVPQKYINEIQKYVVRGDKEPRDIQDKQSKLESSQQSKMYGMINSANRKLTKTVYNLTSNKAGNDAVQRLNAYLKKKNSKEKSIISNVKSINNSIDSSDKRKTKQQLDKLMKWLKKPSKL